MQSYAYVNFIRALDKFYSEFCLYIEGLLENAAYFVLAYTVLCVLVYKLAKWKKSKDKAFDGSKRAMLVIAHPDDECMFFGPTLIHLRRLGVEVYILCLSIGNFYKQGRTRRSELYEACSLLDIKQGNVLICLDSYMPDDPNLHWPSDYVADVILHRVETLSIDTLITFDSEGVSGHRNHSSIFYAVARLCLENRFSKECQIFTLDSVNVVRKYWSYLDLPTSFLLASHWFVLSVDDSKAVVAAMKKHKSQMLWFRRLYVLFSRYMVINTLRNVTTMDLELELLGE